MLLEGFLCYLDPVSLSANSDRFCIAMLCACVCAYLALLPFGVGAYLVLWTTDQTIYDIICSVIGIYSKGLNLPDANYFCNSNVQGLFCLLSLQSMSYSHLKKSWQGTVPPHLIWLWDCRVNNSLISKEIDLRFESNPGDLGPKPP